MTGREALTAIRPMEAFAATVTRFAEIAHEAIRLEEGQAAATRRLAELTASVTAGSAEVERLRFEARDLTATLAAERAAAEHETADLCAGRIAAADAEVRTRQQAVESWAAQERAARERFERTAAELRASELTLIERVNTLKDLAQRLARSAEAVLR